ncbi:hypothetical protein [Trabulsiella odontotermitis]|uniref:hypothetical protein n=1 Tax=Trabulsiella odontotermitis TaxID=379893 RepID=UPI0006BA4F48|nr:hypothetical protein [Trabulsiella odontotermitis]
MNTDEYLEKLTEGLTGLTFQQKLTVGIFFLRKQISAVAGFDKIYSEQLLPFYEEIINMLTVCANVGCDTSVLRNKLQHCSEKIPDTEEFTSEVGSFAQHAMISACYLLSFCLDQNPADFHKTLEMAVENFYIQNKLSDVLLSNDLPHELILNV